MNYTFDTNVGDGVTAAYPFSFAGQDTGYLRNSDIRVFVAGVPASFNIIPSDPNKVYLTVAPPVGAEVLIRRIMPKNIPYSDFSRSNPFSQDTLNNTNLQQLYIVQELLDGFLPDGFYMKQDVNMGGHKLINLGDGVNPGDSVNKGQLDELSDKVESLIHDLTGLDVRTVPVTYLASGGEYHWQVSGWVFDRAILFINGVFQNQILGAYSISSNGFYFPEALQQGDEVYALIGNGIALNADVSANNVVASRYVFPTGVTQLSGMGNPDGVVSAPIGSTFHRLDGGAGSSFYVKEYGSSVSGWVAK